MKKPFILAVSLLAVAALRAPAYSGSDEKDKVAADKRFENPAGDNGSKDDSAVQAPAGPAVPAPKNDPAARKPAEKTEVPRPEEDKPKTPHDQRMEVAGMLATAAAIPGMIGLMAAMGGAVLVAGGLLGFAGVAGLAAIGVLLIDVLKSK